MGVGPRRRTASAASAAALTTGERHGGPGRIHRARQHGAADGAQPRPARLRAGRPRHRSGQGRRLRERGARVVDSPEQVAAGTERTIVMVETTAQAESVIAGERGIIKSAARGHIVICMSTIDPFALRRLAEQLSARGVATLDAPVSGGTERAASGELSIIVGGDAATFEECRDLFAAMGTKLFHVGALGQGLAMKLVNNMLIQVNRVAVAEALVMGVKAGLDPRTIYDVVRVSTGTSYAFETGV